MTEPTTDATRTRVDRETSEPSTSRVLAFPAARAHTQELLDEWFSTIDDRTTLDRHTEPFQSRYARWYGKQPDVDRRIRWRFEGLLETVTRDERAWSTAVRDFAGVPRGLLALLVLVDQTPRNMYRNTPRMYAHDGRGLALAERAIREHAEDATLPLVQRMFLYVPLLHAEDLDVQERAVVLFRVLTEQARQRSPQNVPFFEMAERSADRHRQAIARFGRFPHRNGLLGRDSTPDEIAFLADADAWF